jgi:hypothetical protein
MKRQKRIGMEDRETGRVEEVSSLALDVGLQLDLLTACRLRPAPKKSLEILHPQLLQLPR